MHPSRLCHLAHHLRDDVCHGEGVGHVACASQDGVECLPVAASVRVLTSNTHQNEEQAPAPCSSEHSNACCVLHDIRAIEAWDLREEQQRCRVDDDPPPRRHSGLRTSLYPIAPSILDLENPQEKKADRLESIDEVATALSKCCGPGRAMCKRLA